MASKQEVNCLCMVKSREKIVSQLVPFFLYRASGGASQHENITCWNMTALYLYICTQCWYHDNVCVFCEYVIIGVFSVCSHSVKWFGLSCF